MVKLIMAGGPVVTAAGLLLSAVTTTDSSTSRPSVKRFTMKPVGWVHRSDASVWIEIDRQFEDALMGLEDFSHVWVFWWLDRNDTPSNRRILQVHPRGDARNRRTGVFATRSPVRPNLIALTLCQVISVDGNRIKIAKIDAFDGTPVIDLKPYLPAQDRPENVRLPGWVHRMTRASGSATKPSTRPSGIT